VPVQLAQDGDRIWVGAGPGGGPRLQSRDYRTLGVLSDDLIGDPASRTGVGVAAFAPYRSPLRAEPHPDRPGDPARDLDLLPPALAGWLAADGYRVLVYAGEAVTDLPEFAHLRGVPTGVDGDGDRTHDRVTAVGGWYAAYVRDGESWPTLHEVGHGVSPRLTDAERADWLAVHAARAWDPYLSNPGEGFADSFDRWVRTARDVGGFFGRLAAARGWDG
jgi:hypothetical protein